MEPCLTLAPPPPAWPDPQEREKRGDSWQPRWFKPLPADAGAAALEGGCRGASKQRLSLQTGRAPSAWLLLWSAPPDAARVAGGRRLMSKCTFSCPVAAHQASFKVSKAFTSAPSLDVGLALPCTASAEVIPGEYSNEECPQFEFTGEYLGVEARPPSSSEGEPRAVCCAAPPIARHSDSPRGCCCCGCCCCLQGTREKGVTLRRGCCARPALA